MNLQAFSADVLRLDAEAETLRIAAGICALVRDPLRRRGVVLGLSGGIDSSLTAALCVRALGPERVLGLFLPEADSASNSTALGRLVAESLGMRAVLEDIAPILEAAGCYRRRDAAIREVCPDYGPGWRSKIVLPPLLGSAGYRVFSLVVESPQGERRTLRLTGDAYLGILAAVNFKQRVRKMMEYHHADRQQYAVAGTPNRLEYDQGFFVKQGDGAADLKPIAHLYKSQVYQLARHLGLPREVLEQPPSTDTYSLPQTQEEFYFSLPYATMDLCLFGRNHAVPAAAVAVAAGLEPEQVERVYRDLDAKRAATRYLHLPPLLVGTVEELEV